MSTLEWFSWIRTSVTKSQKAEAQLLNLAASFRAKLGLVDIGDKIYINTFMMENSTKSNLPTTSQDELITQQLHPAELTPVDVHEDQQLETLVMTHGYGAGLGFYYRCFKGLAKLTNWRIYAIDWLGMANSSRPPFPKQKRNQSEDDYITESEDFFVDSLEKWRDRNNIQKMTLLGHSLGGYLSTCYAMKYPDRVKKLILVSPAGIAEKPADARILPTWAAKMWESNITPMSVIRTIGPFGPSLVRMYTDRRFHFLPPTENDALRDYLYHICAQKGSGEYALAVLLQPGAWAQRPMVNRMHKLMCPVTFVYGDRDWMDYEAALKAVENMNVSTEVCLIAAAGHHVHVDNPDGFNEAVIASALNKPGLSTDRVMYVSN